MTENHGILVVGEVDEGRLASITKEVLGGARKMGDYGNEEVHLLLLGEEASPLAQEGIQYGADKVYIAVHPVFSESCSEARTFLISELCNRIQPSLCMMGQTDLGRDVAPRIAARLEAGLCMDCVEVNLDPEKGKYLQTRSVYGGKAMAKMDSGSGRIQINTVRPKSMAPLSAQRERKGKIIMISEGPDPSSLTKVKCLKREVQEKTEFNLEEAKVIVAGGGGVGGAEGLQKIKELAKVLGGAVGVTRVPVDEKWAPLSMEIGQTGKIVTPDLYVAVGISGAAQHITGVQKTKCIVAINKDPDANIFKFSDLGWAADYRVAVPALIQECKRRFK